NLKRVTTNPRAYIFLSNPELKVAEITKTGPWEVTVKLPIDALITGISRFGDNQSIYPPEVLTKYGDMENWRNSVGTGSFMMTEYVAGSNAVLSRNPNYWGKDPVGPGKGNQLPYLDNVRLLVMPDASTRLAALRTGKIDYMSDLGWEDAAQMRKTTPALSQADAGPGGGSKIWMRTDKTPFNDIRVRQAMMMATDFNTILQSLLGGKGQINTFPFGKVQGYEALYLDLNDPDFPQSAKELYTYNPDKAKQLLKDAGYPSGFKTSILITAPQVDNYSIIKGMWSKVGIDLALDVKDTAVYNAIGRDRSYEALSTTGGQGPTATFYLAISLTGQGGANGSMISDPFINDAVAKIRRTAITDMRGAMVQMRELTKYVIPQAYAIPGVSGYMTHFWWSWIKNYSGEKSMGYYNTNNWPQYIWLDQALKKAMGY
ncbi:MAG: ABC transporter substrate-binding protein, partial [Chloroflexota bacterium]